MRKILLSMAMVLLIGIPGGFAQGGGTSTAVKNSPGTGVPPAPVGHRQPRAADFPDEKNSLNNPNDPLARENALLDKKLKGICRGC